MSKIKKALIGALTGAGVIAFAAVNSFAATVTLPPEFDDVKYLVEIVLKIVEFLAKVISMFS